MWLAYNQADVIAGSSGYYAGHGGAPEQHYQGKATQGQGRDCLQTMQMDSDSRAAF